jgi:hypothetical protein
MLDEGNIADIQYIFRFGEMWPPRASDLGLYGL